LHDHHKSRAYRATLTAQGASCMHPFHATQEVEMPLSGSKLLLFSYLESIEDTGRLPADGCDIQMLEAKGFVRTSATSCELTRDGQARLEKLRAAQRGDGPHGNVRSMREHLTGTSARALRA